MIGASVAAQAWNAFTRAPIGRWTAYAILGPFIGLGVVMLVAGVFLAGGGIAALKELEGEK